jgi:hypothetical protein
MNLHSSSTSGAVVYFDFYSRGATPFSQTTYGDFKGYERVATGYSTGSNKDVCAIKINSGSPFKATVYYTDGTQENDMNVLTSDDVVRPVII